MRGLRAVGVECDNMVTLLDIAARAGVTRETARLWATGARGPGGFPGPILTTRGGERVWDWEQVAIWVREYRQRSHLRQHTLVLTEGSAEVRVLSAANHVLAARDALMSEPDDSVREEFERLLEDA